MWTRAPLPYLELSNPKGGTSLGRVGKDRWRHMPPCRHPWRNAQDGDPAYQKVAGELEVVRWNAAWRAFAMRIAMREP